MNRRVALGAGLAVLLVGGAAVAEDPSASSTVTITVEAQPRTLTVTGSPALSVPAQTLQQNDVFDDSARLSFANPTGNAAAKVVATRENGTISGNTDLGSVQLGVQVVKSDPSDSYTANYNKWSSVWGIADAVPLVGGIAEGASFSDVVLMFSIAGTTGDPRVLTTTVNFTIVDE